MSTTEDQVRSGYTLGLRKLAGVLDAHPEIPLPSQGDDGISPIYIGFWGGDAKDRLAEAARVFPCSWDKDATDRHFNLNGRLGGLHVQLTASRDRVCTRVVTGTEEREVEETVTPAVTRKIVKQVEVVEWQCSPLLASAALAGETDAEITRQQPVANCGAQAPGEGVRCTRPASHNGYHIARGPDGKDFHTWSPEDAGCSECGATDTPLRNGRCNESHLCAERAAARDAEGVRA